MPPSEFGQVPHQPVKQAGRVRKTRGGPPAGSGTSSLARSPSSEARSRPACTRASRRTAAHRACAGPIWVPRRTSSLSVKVRGQAPGSVTTAYLRCSLVIARTSAASARSAADTTRLRCAAPRPVPGQHRDQLGGEAVPWPVSPADRTGTSPEGRRARPVAGTAARPPSATGIRSPCTAPGCLAGPPPSRHGDLAVFPGIAVNRPPPVSRETNKSTGTTIPADPEFRLRLPWRSVLGHARAHLARLDRHSLRSAATYGSERSHNERIRLRADLSRLWAYPAAPEMVGRLAGRARPGRQPGVLADRKKQYSATAQLLVQPPPPRTASASCSSRSPRHRCRPSCSWSPAPRCSGGARQTNSTPPCPSPR